MSIYTLPNEIIALLPAYLNNIETFTNASSACRLFRDNFATASPKTILQLAAASAPTFFSPHPHFLVAATARQASAWVLQDPATRTPLLHQALRGGIPGLYEFCLEHAGLTLAEIRRLHLARFDILNPLSDRIDKMAGRQWYQTEHFWDGGVSEPWTIQTEADRATFQIVIYGELFGPDMDAFLAAGRRTPDKPVHSIETRLEFIKYCVPDAMCLKGYRGFAQPENSGPYANLEDPWALPGDQVALQHILSCRRWRRMWADAMRMISRDEADGKIEDNVNEESWRTKLWRDALLVQGLWGMQLVTLPEARVAKEWLDKGRWLREQIWKLDGPLETRAIGEPWEDPVSLAPDPSQDVFVCMAALWRM
ncbi:uncharacterized protein BO97DRAFT_233133 [Aspergillus homomorphus CBS 101889]|uniref:Uncharacterized protein n=1 Tax=Aspergillus homomorphus (strain CBS 101889) TaxID=1450537 RepID=A0A395HK40_ASPHC|nr:hypothetical protein BO97DRAFT_233133 [Aspergillus homomorphus CBS 101889]RAL07793.1 hypothetical protein BO97DRAFT_233133 [Aspergillus homomorphus CBS 101889]